MDKKWRETFLNYSKLNIFKWRVKKAEKIIERALQRFKKPYIAFSGGKDSTCVLDLVLRQANIDVYHWDFGRLYIPEDIHNEIKENARKIGGDLKILECKYGRKFTEDFREFTALLLCRGYDSVFVGIRKEESRERNRRLSRNISITKIKEIFPIADWTWMDVWAYIVSRNLPYCSHYDRYGPVVGWNRVRFSSYFDSGLDNIGASDVDGVLNYKFKCVIIDEEEE